MRTRLVYSALRKLCFIDRPAETCLRVYIDMTLRRVSSHDRLCFSLCVLWLCSWATLCSAQSHLIFVIDGERENNGVTCTKYQGEPLLIGCGYRNPPIDQSDITLTDVTAQSHKLTLREDTTSSIPFFEVLSHMLEASETFGEKIFVCAAEDYDVSVEVTVNFVERTGTPTSCTSSTTPTPTDTPSTSTPHTDKPSTDTPSTDTPSTDTPSTDTPSTDNNGGDSTQSSGRTSFKGLKPLIYTVASVILLGTLAIVAIVTCWIRARRSYHNRVIRPNNTPQDYLDYISDSEFTPLTTSEFMASLQERPPTYNQSEEMLQQTDTTTGSTGETATTATSGGGESATQSGTPGTQATATTTVSEGAVVERRRPRGGSAGRRRRRHLVIVENNDLQSDGNVVTSVQGDLVTSVQGGVVTSVQGGVVTSVQGGVTQDELQGRESDHRQRIGSQTASSSSTSSGNGGSRGNNVTVLVNVQLPSLELPASQPQRSSSVPTQREIEAIEARIDMVENLSPPPNNDHHATPSSDEAGKNTSNNLIDFSSSSP